MHIWHQRQDSNLGHIGRKRVLSPLHYTLSSHRCYKMEKLALLQTPQKENYRWMEALLIREFSQAGKIVLSLRKFMETSLENSKVLSVLLYHCGLGDPTHLRPKSSICHPMSAIGVNLCTTALIGWEWRGQHTLPYKTELWHSLFVFRSCKI